MRQGSRMDALLLDLPRRLMCVALVVPASLFLACGSSSDDGGLTTPGRSGAGGSIEAGGAGSGGRAAAGSDAGGEGGSGNGDAGSLGSGGAGDAGASSAGAGGASAAGGAGSGGMGAAGSGGSAGTSTAGSGGSGGTKAGGSGGAAATGGGGGAGGVKADTRIDPIEVGRTWTYDVKMIGSYPPCPSGTHVSKAVSSQTLDGKTAISVSSLCANAGEFQYAVEGDRVFAYFDAKWRLSLDAPVEPGHAWSDGFFTYEWQKAPSFPLSSETLVDCYRAAKTKVSYESSTVFCRGVGPVRWHYDDGLGNGYDALLTSYTR